MRLLLTITTGVALFTLPLPSQAIELRSGEIVEGRVLSIDAERVTIEAVDADAPRRQVALGDLDPRAAYALLAQRTAEDDPRALLQLGERSAKLGLPSHAIAAFKQAAVLDPRLQVSVAQRIAAVRAETAQKIVVDAQTALDEGRWAAAKLNAQVVVDRYRDTPSAGPAAALVREAVARGRGETAATAAPEPALRRALDLAQRHETAADQIELPASVGFTVKEQRLRQQAVAHLEAAWRELGKLMPEQGSAGAETFAAARVRVRDKLSGHYVALARTFVQRRSVNQAEEYNAKACALDPAGGGCQHTQDLIVHARLTSGYGF